MLDGSFWRETVGYIFWEDMGEWFEQGSSKVVSSREKRFCFFSSIEDLLLNGLKFMKGSLEKWFSYGEE